MDNKYNKLVQRITHLILFMVSSILSSILFVDFVTPIWQKPIMGVLAVGFEFLKLYLLHKIMQDKKTFVRIITYTGLALLSGVATLSFAIGSISEQTINVEYENLELTTLYNTLAIYDEQIATLQEASSIDVAEKSKMNDEDDIYYTGQNRMTDSLTANNLALDEIIENRSSIIQEINILLETENIQVSTNDKFKLMADKINELFALEVTEQDVIFYLFLLLVILLELGLVLTYDENYLILNITQERMLEFLDNIIIDKEGIECRKKYRDIKKQYNKKISSKEIEGLYNILSNSYWKGQPLCKNNILVRDYNNTKKLIELIYKE